MAGEIDFWRGSAGTGSATFNAESAVDSWMKKRGFWVTPKYARANNTPPSFMLAQGQGAAAPNIPSVNSQLSFTAGEQIGFAS